MTGFTLESARALRVVLESRVIPKSPLTEPVPRLRATLVHSDLLIEVYYRHVTPEGWLRHDSFKGLRDDLRTVMKTGLSVGKDTQPQNVIDVYEEAIRPSSCDGAKPTILSRQHP